MLEFKQSDTAATIIVTLAESTTIPNPYYLFIFRNIETKDDVALIINSASDLSLFKSRYNKFQINAATVFGAYLPGKWNYRVYQQVSSTNTDPTQAGIIIESGQMILDRAADFSYNTYSAATAFKAYDGI